MLLNLKLDSLLSGTCDVRLSPSLRHVGASRVSVAINMADGWWIPQLALGNSCSCHYNGADRLSHTNQHLQALCL
jgi:hypothetical protein